MKMLWGRIHLLPVLLLLSIWSGWFIYQSSFVIEGERYYSLFDDAMISMTYAKNVTQGHGLNWAKYGDPVEGYTSPLWTLAMVPFQLLPIAWSKVSLAFAVFCVAVLWGCVLLLDRILADRLSITNRVVRTAAAVTIAFLYPLNFWTLVGMECGAQTLIFLWGLDQFLAWEAGKSERHLLGLGGVLAAAMLLRMDMVFFVGIVILFMAPWLWQHKRLAVRFLAVAGLPMVVYLLFRILYFHDIFPNTYYLKLYKIPLSVRMERAWPYFVMWAKPLWLLWWTLPLAMVALRRSRAMWLSLSMVVTYLAYDIYAGGDAWEFSDVGANRFTIIVIPWVLVILVAGAHAWAQRLRGAAGKVAGIALPSAFAFLILVLVNGLMFVAGTGHNWKRMKVEEQPFNTQFQMWNVMATRDLNAEFGTANRVAVVQAGDMGYFFHGELVDVMGYNDREIAHGPACRDLTQMPADYYLPGHVKVDYKHLILVERPDYIRNLWFREIPEMEAETMRLLEEQGYVKHEMLGYVRRDFVRRDR